MNRRTAFFIVFILYLFPILCKVACIQKDNFRFNRDDDYLLSTKHQSRYILNHDDLFCINVSSFNEDPLVEKKFSAALGSSFYAQSFGDSGEDIPLCVKMDSTGAIYIVGFTTSEDFPIIAAFDESYNGRKDCFIIKINPDNNEVVFSTFIGGSYDDYANSIIIDNQDNVYITGTTNSSDFPILNAYDESYNGGFDCFVLKMSSNGTLLYSTFVGGSSSEFPYSIAVDEEGCAYITGAAGPSYPVVNAYDSSYNGGAYDCFILKLNNLGDQILYSSFIGGNASDYGVSIETDNANNIFVLGNTDSINFLDENRTENTKRDSFVVKLNISNNTIEFSSIIGGSGEDFGNSMILTQNNTILVAGETWSSEILENQSTVNAYSGNGDCYVVGLNSTLGTTIFANYIGGSEYDSGESIAVDPLGNIVICGTTMSSDFPLLNAYDESYNGHYDCFVTTIAGTETELLQSTFIGGFRQDRVFDSEVDALGYVHVIGQSNSPDFPIMKGPEINSSQGRSIIFSLASTDSDNDGLSDSHESIIGTNPNILDTDSDGMPDKWEFENELNPLIDDSNDDIDNDGLTNLNEFIIGTDPNNADSDDDGLNDGQEVLEYETDPLNVDTDEDGLTDYEEVQMNTNPLSADTDGDNLLDNDEISIYNTNPLSSDSDNDGVSDGIEVNLGLNPLLDDVHQDHDNDGILTIYEIIIGTNPFLNDSDGDGLIDGWEVSRGLNPLVRTRQTGEAFELFLLFFVSGVISSVSIVLVISILKRFTPIFITIFRDKDVLVSAVAFLLLTTLSIPISVHGLNDPGPNSIDLTVNSNSTNIESFTVLDSPYYAHAVNIELILVDPHPTSCGCTILLSSISMNYTLVFNVNSSSLEMALVVEPEVYNVSLELNPQTQLNLQLTQIHIDGRNIDQKEWPVLKGVLITMGIAYLIIAIIIWKKSLQK